MSAKKIQRVLLRKILFRVDFQFIPESIQDDIFKFAIQNYGQYFSYRTSEQERAISIEVDASNFEQPRTDAKMQNVFVLSEQKTQSTDGRRLKIGKTFIFLEVDFNIESMRIRYSEIFQNVIDYAKKSCNGTFRPVRVGLRKFNRFLLYHQDIAMLDKIFVDSFFDNIDDRYELKNCNAVRTYEFGEYTLNYINEYDTGVLQQDEEEVRGHLISFDFDIYSLKEDTVNHLNNNIWSDMGQHIYNFYSGIIREEVVNALKTDSGWREYKIIPY